MKRSVYIALFLIGGIALGYWLLTSQKTRPKKLDKSFTLSKYSFKPYDTKVFYDQLTKDSLHYFYKNEQPIVPENEEFNKYIDSQLYVVVAPYYIPEYHEIRRLKEYIGYGNSGLICSFNLGAELLDSLFQTDFGSENAIYRFPPILRKTNTKLIWEDSLGFTPQNYIYPGHTATNELSFEDRIERSKLDIIPILKDSKGNIQMLKIKIGEGEIYLSNNPLIFSNYFLLHKDNYQFLNQLLSLLKAKDRDILWDDYYKDYAGNLNSGRRESEVLKTINKYPALKIAFYAFILAVLLFILFYSRRVQKEVEVLPMAKNQTLDFVKVITGLYWNEQNHLLMARKMHSHFLESLSFKYHFYSREVCLENLDVLSNKTGRNVNILEPILSDIDTLKNLDTLGDKEFIKMYQNIQKFYKK